jgi:hypothetical protein
MDIKEAFEIVLGLAEQAALEERGLDVELLTEAAEQREAIYTVYKWKEENL